MKTEPAQEPLCFGKKEAPPASLGGKDPKEPHKTQTVTLVERENRDTD
jgi:hypothetical protein